MREHRDRTWLAGSATVEANLDSPASTWILRARKGTRWYVDLASGPLSSRAQAEAIAARLNTLDIDLWNWFILRELPDLLRQAWG
jgi:hypothetical protein